MPVKVPSSLTLSYESMSISFTPSGSTIDIFSDTDKTSSFLHNNPHYKFLSNDLDIKTKLNQIITEFGTKYDSNILYNDFNKGYYKLVNEKIIFQWINVVDNNAIYSAIYTYTWRESSWTPYIITVSCFNTTPSYLLDEFYQIRDYNSTQIRVIQQAVDHERTIPTRAYIFGIGTYT